VMGVPDPEGVGVQAVTTTRVTKRKGDDAIHVCSYL